MIDFDKGNGLVPVIVQDYQTFEVLMLGYVNEEAWNLSIETKYLTFYSRSKNRIWKKGEESGNFLILKDYKVDCDQDTILAWVEPQGPTCHTGSRNCFNQDYRHNFLFKLEQIVENRFEFPTEESYVNRLRNRGINKIAQKVGEEAVETVIAALVEKEEDFINETSDLLFHLLVLLKEKNISLESIAKNLESRHQ